MSKMGSWMASNTYPGVTIGLFVICLVVWSAAFPGLPGWHSGVWFSKHFFYTGVVMAGAAFLLLFVLVKDKENPWARQSEMVCNSILVAGLWLVVLGVGLLVLTTFVAGAGVIGGQE